MSRLPDDVQREFSNGNFGVRWTDGARFTTVDLDLATEWVSRIGKTSGGYSGLTQTPSALLK